MRTAWHAGSKRDGKDKAPATKRDQVAYIQQCMDSTLQLLAHLLSLDDAGEDPKEEVDHVVSSCDSHPPSRPLTKSTRLRDIPAWAADAENRLGELPWTEHHFIARVVINDVLLEAMKVAARIEPTVKAISTSSIAAPRWRG